MDQVKQYLKPAPRRAGLWWLLLAGVVAATAWSGFELYRRYENLSRQEQILAALRQAAANRVVPKPSRTDLESQRQWNELRQELDFSWYPMFAALERTSNPNIALLEFLPDKVAGRLRLRGTARDIEALTTYLAALSAEPYFYNVYLSHQKKVVQNNIEAISFEVRMEIRRD